MNNGVTRSISYTPTGNTASDNHGNGTVVNFTYDEARRVVQVANQNQPLASYTHNFLGQRAQKTTSSTITQFVYDRSGHLLAESDGATGAAQTEYIWFDDTPLALVTAGNLYYIHPDHLGTPQKATDANQNLAWDAVLRPFGTVEQQTFPPLTNLRFPGQYFDVESALHQNWFRDYDPSIGRYIESDPIGLRGGINTYAYVHNDLLNNIDPTGLDTLEVGIAGSINIPFVSVSIPLGLGVAVDTQGHAGIYGYAGGGAQVGAEVDAGMSVQVSNAPVIGDLTGPFGYVSAHGGAGVGGSVDFFGGSSQDGLVTGGGVTLGGALGASLSGGVTNTWLYAPFGDGITRANTSSNGPCK